MKYPNLIKITALILIEAVFFLQCSLVFAEDKIEKDDFACLAPALQINTNIQLYQFYSVDVVKPWNKVDVVLKEQRPLNGAFANRIEVSFRYDQVGFFDKILDAVGKEGKLIWFEMGQKKGKKIFRFSVVTKTKQNRIKIIDNIKKIDDIPTKQFEKRKIK
jgi:hypothetical protein